MTRSNTPLRLALLAPFALSPLFAGQTAMSALNLREMEQGWGAPAADKAVSGKPLRAAGVTFKSGVGTHAPSEFSVRLAPGKNRFRAQVAPDENAGGKGSVEFIIRDAKGVIWRSGVMRAGDKPKPVDVDLTGRTEVTFAVSDGGDGNTNDHADWLDAVFFHAGAVPLACKVGCDPEPGRLTPPESPAPRVNGAKVFGVRPGSPVFFRMAVSGERPMKFTASGLPSGVTLDPATGVLTGKLSEKGEYKFTLSARNARGEASSVMKLVVGDRIALTPPMGWNSWYCFSEAVSAEHIEGMAKAMHDSGLANYGWTYVNIDDCWNAAERDADGVMKPNERFPDMPGLVAKIHGYGLKAGIYSTPWIASYAGFLGGSLPNEQADFGDAPLPLEKRRQPAQFIGTYPAVHRKKLDRVGPVWRFDRDMKRYAEWGFDYIKVDWNPLDIPTLKRVSEAVRGSGRDIVLSLSNHADRKLADGYAQYAELWRTSGDINDSWGSVSGIGFNQNPAWQPVSKPGNWNDPDMLQVGIVGKAGEMAQSHPTHLTPNEQYSQVSLWAVQASPLILSCDLRKLDDFTLGLLANREVIAVNQDELGVAGTKHDLGGDLVAFVKPLSDGSHALALFNKGGKAVDAKVALDKLGLTGRHAVRDLWRCADEPAVSGTLAARLGRHGVKFVKLTPAK